MLKEEWRWRRQDPNEQVCWRGFSWGLTPWPFGHDQAFAHDPRYLEDPTLAVSLPGSRLDTHSHCGPSLSPAWAPPRHPDSGWDEVSELECVSTLPFDTGWAGSLFNPFDWNSFTSVPASFFALVCLIIFSSFSLLSLSLKLGMGEGGGEVGREIRFISV